jgi:hypothetical protein
VGEAAADGAAVTHLIMRDVTDSLGKQRVRKRELALVLDVPPSDARAEADAFFVDCDCIESRHVAQVDEERRLREPEGHRRQQTLAAGEDPRLAFAGREQRHDFADSRRRRILERRKLHECLPGSNKSGARRCADQSRVNPVALITGSSRSRSLSRRRCAFSGLESSAGSDPD